MSDPIPVILCGKNPSLARQVVAGLAPRFDVLHCCCTLEAAVAEIPQVLERRPEIKPSSGIGSNMDRSEAGPRPRPVLVLTGGAFSDEEFATARNAADICKSVTWMKADMSKFPKDIIGKGPPPVSHIVNRVLESADKHGITADTETPADTIWYW